MGNTNFGIIFKMINIWGVKAFFTVDLKARNMICGVGPHSSKYPCVMCKTSKDDFAKTPCGQLRTVSDLAKDHMDYKHSVDTAKTQTLEECLECYDLVMEHCPPSELHITLGFTNHLYKEMHQRWPELVLQWASKALCKREPYHGGEFEGNQCKKLLDNTQYLEDSFGNPQIFEMTPFINSLKSFNKIRVGCFNANYLAPNYKELVDQFRNDYMVLVENFNVSIPSKVHEVFCHVTDWYDRHPDLFLGRFSEQSDESLHSKFKKFCEQRNLIKNVDSPNYGSSLCLAVATFNSKQI